jgi:hypothetical protein
MKKELKLYSRVTNGKLSDGVALTLCNAIEDMEGKNLIITVKEQSKRRSERQNAFYWGVVIPAVKGLFEAAGTTCTPEDVHCYLKEHVGGMMKIIFLPDGSRRAIVESSTKLSTAEWELFMTKIRAWGAGWGIVIPEPNESLEPPAWIDEVLQGQQLRDMRG